MNPTLPTNPNERTRAVKRLRTLTIRSAVAGLAAVGGFGFLAAMTYAGGNTSATTTAVTPSGTTSTPSATTSTPNGTTSSTPSPTLQAATPAPTTTTRHAHATTGGS